MQQIIECPTCGGIFIDGIFKVKVGKPFKQKDYAARVCQFNTQDPNTKPCINPYYVDPQRNTNEKLDSGYPTGNKLDKRSIKILKEVLPDFGINEDPTTLLD